MIVPTGSTQKKNYPKWYTSDDDLNQDGVIDSVEAMIKVQTLKDGIIDKLDTRVKAEYTQKVKKEVDFHHKVAYRFEKCFRLGKEHLNKK